MPVDLVIDHSVQVDAFGTSRAFDVNADRDYERNGERYAFLRWGQQAFDNLRVVPPATGICHQVNLEYLGQVVFSRERDGNPPQAYPDTLVGTDSHTTMINGLGVLGWGVGGIEAEAAMLGQPISMLLPQVVGFKLGGELSEGATATDLVLTVTAMLRQRGVVGKFVEFFGPGLRTLGLADRATIGNMSPEFGSTCAIFPVDSETLRYLEFTGRPTELIELVDAYARRQGLFHDRGTRRSRPSPRRWSSTWARSSRASRARSARRTGFRSRRQNRRSSRRCASSAQTPSRSSAIITTRRSPARFPPRTRPATTTTTSAAGHARRRVERRPPSAGRTRSPSRWRTGPRSSSTTAGW